MSHWHGWEARRAARRFRRDFRRIVRGVLTALAVCSCVIESVALEPVLLAPWVAGTVTVWAFFMGSHHALDMFFLGSDREGGASSLDRSGFA